MIVTVLIFLLTYGISSLMLLPLFFRIFKVQDQSEVWSISILTMGLGPISISFILYNLFLFFPRHSAFFYIIIISAFFLLILLPFYKQIPKLRYLGIGLVKSVKDFRTQPGIFQCITVLIVALCVFMFIQGVNFPIVTHDDAIYANQSKMFFRNRSFDNYPMSEADAKTGFYAINSHPLGMHMLYTWFFLIRGSAESDILCRSVAPMCSIFCVILLWYVLRRRGNRYSGLLGALALITVPLFIKQGFHNTIDPIRIYFGFLALVWLAKLLEEDNLKIAIATGIFTGLAAFTHTIMILSLPVALITYLILSRQIWRRKILIAVLITIIGGIVGGAQYYLNYEKFGTPLGVVLPSELGRYWAGHNLRSRGQNTEMRAWLYGRLQPFTRISGFGISWYLFVISLFLWLRYSSKDTLDKILLISALLYGCIIVYRGWSNWRYIFTIQPMVAYFTGLVWGKAYEESDENPIRRMWPIILIVALMIPIQSVRSGKLGFRNSLKYFFRSDKEKVLQTVCTEDVFRTIDYINTRTPEDSVCLVFRGPRYFYYADRKGIVWYDPRMHGFYEIQDTQKAYDYLLKLDVGYILIDSSYELHNAYRKSELKNILANKDMCQLVYQAENAKVYRLVSGNANPR